MDKGLVRWRIHSHLTEGAACLMSDGMEAHHPSSLEAKKEKKRSSSARVPVRK
jgi:hypothetical protein